MNNHINIFTYIYENCIWGSNKNESYKGSSGIGSILECNIYTWIPFIKQFILDNKISTIVDLGCGDFVCGRDTYDDLENIRYYGYDAYDKVIENNSKNCPKEKYHFMHLDFYNQKEDIVAGDLCILKDVIMHWSLKDINTFLDYLTTSQKFKYILIVNCCEQVKDNTDIHTGGWRELSANYYPLKKYNPEILYYFMANVIKEVSVINTTAI